jgi:hypothetical protein
MMISFALGCLVRKSYGNTLVLPTDVLRAFAMSLSTCDLEASTDP